MGRPARPSELAFPVVSLAAMRHSLTNDVGTDAAARALRAAGYAAGDGLFTALTQPFISGSADHQPDVSTLNANTFWKRLSQLFSTRGWGTLSHHAVHEGVGALDSTNWVECVEDSATRPSCFFTTGLLANLIGRAAGAQIAVLEVECRSRGDQRCRFLFGAPETLNSVYGLMRSGDSADESLRALV